MKFNMNKTKSILLDLHLSVSLLRSFTPEENRRISKGILPLSDDRIGSGNGIALSRKNLPFFFPLEFIQMKLLNRNPRMTSTRRYYGNRFPEEDA